MAQISEIVCIASVMLTTAMKANKKSMMTCICLTEAGYLTTLYMLDMVAKIIERIIHSCLERAPAETNGLSEVHSGRRKVRG